MTTLADLLTDDLRAKVTREAVDARPIYADPRQRVQDIYAETLPDEGSSFFPGDEWNRISINAEDDFTFTLELESGAEFEIEVDEIRWLPVGIKVDWRAKPV